MRFALCLPRSPARSARPSAFPLAASAEPRMLIGFQDDPSLRWRDDRAERLRRRRAGALQASSGRRSTGRGSRERRPANGANPFDPAYRFDDLDEFVRNAGLHGMEVMLTIWGTPAWANGGKGQNYAPTELRRPAELRAGGRRALLGPVPRLPVRPLLHGLERVEPRPVPLAAVRLEGQAGRADDLREALPRRVRRHQGRQLPRARRHRRDLGPRPRPATSASRARRRRSRRASSPSCSRSRSRASGSTPGRTTRTRPRSSGKPTQKVALAERDA